MKERTLKLREYSIRGLFKHIGAGNKLHVPLNLYKKFSVQVECSRRNEVERTDPMNNKYATSTTEKEGYIPIFQRY